MENTSSNRSRLLKVENMMAEAAGILEGLEPTVNDSEGENTVQPIYEAVYGAMCELSKLRQDLEKVQAA
jgi:hypothetical protein